MEEENKKSKENETSEEIIQNEMETVEKPEEVSNQDETKEEV